MHPVSIGASKSVTLAICFEYLFTESDPWRLGMKAADTQASFLKLEFL
jgi:hypothetical protein